MTQPDDWSDLTQAWTQPPQEPLRPDAALLRAVSRRDWLARWNFRLELAGGVAVVGVLAWAVLGRGLPVALAIPGLLFVVFALGMTLWSRRGDQTVLTDTPEAVLRSAIAQARLGLRWAWAGIAISLAAMAFLATITGLTNSPSGQALTTGIVGGLFLGGCILGYGLHARRCRRRMALHQDALSALLEP